GYCGDGVCSSELGENFFNCQYPDSNGNIVSDCMNMCGDGICQSAAGENTTTCPVDCNVTTTTVRPTTTTLLVTTTTLIVTTTTSQVTTTTIPYLCFGGSPNGVCEPIEESNATCPQDCRCVGGNPNGICEFSQDESSNNCPQDCNCTLNPSAVHCGGQCFGGKPNGVCEPIEESNATCPQDCKCVGGSPNGTCDATESEASCPQDCKNECPYYKFSTVQIPGEGLSPSAYVLPFMIDLPCFRVQATAALAYGYITAANSGKVARTDDYIVSYFMSQANNPNSIAHNASCIPGPNTFCAVMTMYFDDQCNPVSAAEATAACGVTGFQDTATFFWMTTPISLIWNQGVDIEENVSLVSFPLDPSKTGKLWSWKASADAPLLVYDPKHSGKIESATQLFGNWTFGGQRVASLVENANQAKPWNNGYDALRTLDLNNDSVISGKELADLALWFDENRDAVSQAGEVRRVDESGLKKIFLNADKKDALSGNISASIGFEKEVNGKTVIGSSVDWFSKGSNNSQEFFARQAMEKAPQSNLPQNLKEVKSEIAAKVNNSSLNGVWAWEIDDARLSPENKKIKGAFLLEDKGDGVISGRSLIEFGLESNSKAKRMMKLYQLLGEKGEKNNISFTVSDEHGNETHTTAQLQADAKVLKGETVANLLDRENKLKKITYKWRATKLAEKDLK
ncbi:MAG: hypothetical protein KBC84_04340, partial [Proteobacteria bacterium]|nr:hypothetical protein [Pseudomonadota bacterium]